MTLNDVLAVLSQIKGCTFASLDAETYPKPGVRKITTGESVIVFTNKSSSGYENMVRRRLLSIGKDPDSFVVGDLPWGTRIPNTPLILNEGESGPEYYLQTILLKEGDTSYYVGKRAVDPGDFGIKPARPGAYQGLPADKAVVVKTYRLESITRLAILGDVIKSSRQKLGVKY